MHAADALRALAGLALADADDHVGTLSQASRIVGKAAGSDDVRLFAGDGVTYEAYPPREGEDFFGLSSAGLISASTALRRLSRPAVYRIRDDGLPSNIAPADGSHAGDYLAMALWKGDAYSGTVVARGPWSAQRARSAGGLLESAAPALAIMFDRVADADRAERIQRQMGVLSSVARVFTRAESMTDVLDDVVNAVNSATGLLSSIDVLDADGLIALRSTAASRYTGTPLYDAWLDMSKAPDHVREKVLVSHEPVLLPDLQNDPSISEESRAFYRAASIVSGATLPLLLEDEVVGLLRVGSLKPTPFEPRTVEILRSLAVQAAIVVKGVQLWEELQRSRKETELFAAKLQASMEIEHHLARIDHLSGLPNRRYLDEVIAAECARTARHGSPLSLAMADLDDFKSVNDEHGHDTGDEALRRFASVARSTCREGDMVGRMGGDEFLFVLPDTDLGSAITWSERLRSTFAETPLLLGAEFEVRLTVSLGVTQADPASSPSPRSLVRCCDESLYEAKAAGKNAIRWRGRPASRTA